MRRVRLERAAGFYKQLDDDFMKLTPAVRRGVIAVSVTLIVAMEV